MTPRSSILDSTLSQATIFNLLLILSVTKDQFWDLTLLLFSKTSKLQSYLGTCFQSQGVVSNMLLIPIYNFPNSESEVLLSKPILRGSLGLTADTCTNDAKVIYKVNWSIWNHQKSGRIRRHRKSKGFKILFRLYCKYRERL